MPRPKPEDISSAGQDSFLDVVTNIVGILIILVMVVGGRVQQIVLTAAPQARAKAAELERELEELDQSAALIESEVADLAEQARTVATAAAFAGEARITLATTVAAAKVEVEKRKQSADKDRVSAAEAAARRKQLEAEIERCTLEAEGLSHAPATMQEVLAYPTPIARTVTGEELHFQIDQGRISYIPLVELFELAKTQTRRHSGSLTSMAQRIETVGPVQDFSLDYVIEVKIDQARGQVLVRSREWVVRPSGPGIGETIEEALQQPHSKFRRVLADVRPDTTVTLWCYPDSFEQFRALREELHRLGIPTAGRPMPEGAPIGGSTDGSKSVVQ